MEIIERTLAEALPAPAAVQKWRAYEEYRDSGVEWLGKVPKHWELNKLGYKNLVIDPQPDHRAPVLAQGEGFPYIGIRDLNTDGTVNRNTARKVEEDAILKQEERFQIENGDIVFCKVGTLGFPRHIKPEGRLALSATLVLIKCGKTTDSCYLRYALDSKQIYQQIDLLSTGSTRPALGIEQIRRILLCFPSLAEQRTIAAFLDHETAKIDALITKQEQLIALLRERRAALISQAVTRGLNPTVPMKDSGVAWLGRVPEHWEVKRLKFAAAFFGGGTPSKENPEYWLGTIPWISPKDMKVDRIADTEDHITEEAVNDSATRIIQPGAVLIVVRSGILRHSIPVAINAMPATINQDMKAIVPKVFLRAKYLAYLISGHQKALLVEWRKQGATVESIEFELLANTCCLIPPLSEQQGIIAFLNQQTAKIDALITGIREGIEKVKEYRIALVSAAVTGKIDVRGEPVVEDDVEEGVAD